ncbi:hypothetical protein F5Y08DRAFT_310805 [Xylaria arbuscula]|nr:hypothetical protein F5Y08DRAFT_310805 [Xylaria arbuscula]
MSIPELTFVTTVGTSGLSESAAKQMRSHVTRSNFAKRRARLAQKNREARRRTSCQPSPANLERDTAGLSASLYTPPQPTNGDSYTQIISSKWSLFFLDGSEYPSSTSEQAWINLLVSEPALVESSLAFALRHWSPGNDYQQIACNFSSKATKTIIQRIASGRGVSDAVLAAILTMAFGERIVHNDVAWNVHIDGAVQLVTERASRGLPALSPLLEHLLIKDTINAVFGFPRFYHKKFVDAARATQCDQWSSLINIVELCERLTQWMEVVDNSRATPQTSEFIMTNIIQPMYEILSQARSLRIDGDLILQASCICVELIVYLSWNCLPSSINLTAIACELKEVISSTQFRPCCYSDLTCCQLMLGALAADEDSPTRTWFTKRLSSAWRMVKSRGCNDGMSILDKNMGFKAGLESRFKYLWTELEIKSLL